METADEHPRFIISHSRTGNGVFAAMDFMPNDTIHEFRGPFLTFAQALAKGPVFGADPIQIDEKEYAAAYIDTQEPGRSINHSCDPNAGIMNNSILVALKPIQQNEEITFDYSTTMDEDCWTMVCHCLSAQCRGVIRDFKYLPPETQQRYLERHVVQDFIAKKFSLAKEKKQEILNV